MTCEDYEPEESDTGRSCLASARGTIHGGVSTLWVAEVCPKCRELYVLASVKLRAGQECDFCAST